MYDASLDMSLVDFAVTCAIKELAEKKLITPHEKQTITADEIAAHIPCHPTTVRRTLPRLIESGSIKRIGSKRRGFWYEVKPRQEAAHARSQ